jgi:hypothetical protein
MPYRFLLIKMLEEYDFIFHDDSLDDNFKDKFIADLKSSNVEFVHMCTDTSADRALRDHSSPRELGTYFLVGLSVNDQCGHKDSVTMQLVRHINASESGTIVDRSTSYQVFTYA